MGLRPPRCAEVLREGQGVRKWEEKRHASRGRGAKAPDPLDTVAVLSFRSHIIGGTHYRNDVVKALGAGLRVLPIFVQGIEATWSCASG